MREEDYDLAMALKEICDKLKIIGHKIITLEQQKYQAIEGEDFLAAKQYKLELDRIRSQLTQIDPLDPFGT